MRTFINGIRVLLILFLLLYIGFSIIVGGGLIIATVFGINSYIGMFIQGMSLIGIIFISILLDGVLFYFLNN